MSVVLVAVACTATEPPRPIPSTPPADEAGETDTAVGWLSVFPLQGPRGRPVNIQGRNCGSSPGDLQTQILGEVTHPGDPAPTGSFSVQRVSTEGFKVNFELPKRASELTGAGEMRIRSGDSIVFHTTPPGICTAKEPFIVTDDPGLTISPTAGPVGTQVVLRGHDCWSIPNQPRTWLFGEVTHPGDPAPFGAISDRHVPTSHFFARIEIPSTAHETNYADGGDILVGDRIIFRTAPGGICDSQEFIVTA